jgi:RNA:NAD 2'-phosphotransferase (TPT1/KptA family)
VSTSFTVKVTSASLCNLTRQFVHASAKYQAATSSQRAVVDLVVNAGCAALNAHQINVYKTGVTVTANNGWLSSSQATTLRSLADKL